MSARLHSPDGRIKGRQRSALVEMRDIVLLPPWLMAFTRGGDARQRDPAQQPSARSTIGGKRGDVEHTDGQVPSEDPVAVSTTAADAMLASATEEEMENAPPWHPDDEYASEVLFNVISPHSVLSRP